MPFTFLHLQMTLTRQHDLVNQMQLEVQILFGEPWRRNYSRKMLHADSTPAGSEVTLMDCIWSMAKRCALSEKHQKLRNFDELNGKCQKFRTSMSAQGQVLEVESLDERMMRSPGSCES